MGLDLGRAGLKLVGIRPDRSVSQWRYPLASGLVWQSNEDEIARIRAFIRSQGLAGCPVAVNLDDDSLKIRKVELPRMPEADRKEAVTWQIREILDGDPANYVIRHSLIDESAGVTESGKAAYMVYAVKKSVIEGVMALVKKLLLVPKVVEPKVVSLLAAFGRVNGFQAGRYDALIEIGESKSLFAVVREGRLYFSRPLSGVGGHEVEKLVQTALNLAGAESSEVRELLEGARQPTDAQLPILDKAESLLPDYHSRVAMEIQRSIDAFYLMFHAEKIHRLYLSGGGARLAGMRHYLAENLAVPTEVLDPSQAFRMNSKESAHVYNVALGLALYPL